MDDDQEENVLKQAYISQMKFLSRFFALGFVQRNQTGMGNFANFARFCLRPEILLIATIFFVVCFYLQAIELNGNGFISRISNSLRFKSRSKLSFTKSEAESDSWEIINRQSAVYAVQGKRPSMEDR